jgi:hypothetical protein
MGVMGVVLLVVMAVGVVVDHDDAVGAAGGGEGAGYFWGPVPDSMFSEF